MVVSCKIICFFNAKMCYNKILQYRPAKEELNSDFEICLLELSLFLLKFEPCFCAWLFCQSKYLLESLEAKCPRANNILSLNPALKLFRLPQK